jgi:hypothetical protein
MSRGTLYLLGYIIGLATGLVITKFGLIGTLIPLVGGIVVIYLESKR